VGTSDVKYDPEWELFDRESDLRNVYDDPGYADTVAELTSELARLQAEIGDEPYRQE